jgi:hypothetical protein
MFLLGYAIIQLPGVCQGCYLAIRSFLEQRDETKKKNNNKIEVQEIHQEQTNTKIEEQVGKTENLNLENYLHLKVQFIRNLQEFTTTGEAKHFKRTDMWEMLMQKEIDFLTQLLENK